MRSKPFLISNVHHRLSSRFARAPRRRTAKDNVRVRVREYCAASIAAAIGIVFVTVCTCQPRYVTGDAAFCEGTRWDHELLRCSFL